MGFFDLAVALLAGVLALGVYVRSLAPGLLWGDSAEFQFAAWLGGFAHPTGYPLYLMLGWVWTHLLPFGDPAFRMNLFSAFWGGLAVALLCLLVMRLIRFVAAEAPSTALPLVAPLRMPDPAAAPSTPLRMPDSAEAPSTAPRMPDLAEAAVANRHPSTALPLVAPLRMPDPAEGEGRLSAGVVAGSRLIALGAALVFTFTPTFWSQAVVAEVYTLHAVFVAALLLALVTWAERAAGGDASGARRSAYLVALLFGLSLAHHRSTILLIPAAALFVLVVLAGSGRRVRVSLRQAALLLACLLAPLLLYLYIPLAAPHAPYFAAPLAAGRSLPLYDATPAGFLAHVSGSVFSASLAAPRPGALDLGQSAGRFADELSLNGVALGALGLGYLLFLAMRGRSWRAWSALALTGVFFVVQVAFNLFYAIGDIYVFYIPAYLVWAVWMACGAWALMAFVGWLVAGQPERGRRAASAIAALLALVVLLAFAYRSAVVNWPKVQRAGDDSARRAWQALLDSGVPAGVILVSNDRDEMVPLWYLTYVEGQRADVTGLFPLIGPGPAWSDVAAVTDSALQTGRPVYLVKPMPGLEVKYDLAPIEGEPTGPLGPAVKVSPQPSAGPAHPVDVVYGDTIRLVGYDVAPEPLVAGQPAQVTLYWEPLRPLGENWTTFVQVVDEGGAKAGQSDQQAGGAFYPTSLWRVGETLRDTHTLSIAPDAAAGERRVIVGLYVPRRGDLQQLAPPQVVGAVKVAE